MVPNGCSVEWSGRDGPFVRLFVDFCKASFGTILSLKAFMAYDPTPLEACISFKKHVITFLLRKLYCRIHNQSAVVLLV